MSLGREELYYISVTENQPRTPSRESSWNTDRDIKSRSTSRRAESEVDNIKENVEEEENERTSSPRRMRDIHLDGRTDSMTNVDPYLLDGKDLDVQSDAGGHAGSVVSDVSVQSWRSLRSPRNDKTHSSTGSALRSSIASRARSIKEHESAPFLSIDLMPETSFSVASARDKEGSKPTFVRASQQSLISASSTGLLSQHSVRSGTPFKGQGKSNLGASQSGVSSFISPVKKHGKTNVNVRSPFKHAIQKDTHSIEKRAPGDGLTERTALANHIFNKILHAQKPTKVKYIAGRLLKARLQPLEPVKVSEPTIHQCRGIVAETRQYSQSESRTLQRWRAIMGGGTQLPYDLRDSQDLRDRASTCESVHRTSEASTPDLGTFNDLEMSLLEEALLANEMEENGEKEELTDTDTTRQALSTATSLPNSRSGPKHIDESLTELEGPDFEKIVKVFSPNPDEVTRDTQPPSGDLSEETIDKQQMSARESESVISASTFLQTSEQTDGHTEEGEGSVGVSELGAMVSSNKRPHSAIYPQEIQHPKPSNIRPKTATDASRKAVRFADEVRTKQKGKSEENISGKGNGKGKVSCRPLSLDSGYHGRDGSDKGGGGGGTKNSTFLTQGGVQTAKSSTSGADNSSSQGSGTKTNNGGKTATTRQVTQTVGVTKSTDVTCTAISDYISNKNQAAHHKTEFSIEQSLSQMKENASSVSRPPSASIAYKSKTKSLESEPKGKPLSTVKDRLDQRFAGYSQKKTQVKSNVSAEKKESMSDLEKKKITKVGGEKHSVDKQVCKTDKEQGGGRISTTDTPVENQTQTVGESSSGRSHRPVSSNAKRAKAYKALMAKTKKGNVCPFQSSVYSDRELREKPQSAGTGKPSSVLRPSSSSFSERTQIQGKHGFLGKPSSAKRPGSAASSKKKSEKSKSLSSKAGQIKSEDIPVISLTLDDTTPGNELVPCLPKSSSKVTFADDLDLSDFHLMAKHTSSRKPRVGSASSGISSLVTETHRGREVMDPSDLNDFDQMWDSLPCDDSDNEETKDNEREVDPLMSKFNILEQQLAEAQIELKEQAIKHTMAVAKHHKPALVEHGEQDVENNEEIITASSVHTTVIPEQVEKDVEVLKYESTFITTGDTEHLEVLEIAEQASSDETKTQIEPGQFLEPKEFLAGEISPFLYQKTHRYVEVKNSKPVQNKKKSTTTIKTSDRQDNLSDTKETTSEKSTESVLKADTRKASLIVIPGSFSSSPISQTSNDDREGEETYIPYQVTNAASAKLTKKKIKSGTESDVEILDTQRKTSASKRPIQFSEDSITMVGHTIQSTAPSQTSAGTAAESDYHDLLLAYRHHCMEDSESEGEEKKEDEQKESKSNRGRPSSSRSLRKSKSGSRKSPSSGQKKPEDIDQTDVNGSEHVSDGKSPQVRPWSGATTDSGIEEDTTNNQSEKTRKQMDQSDKDIVGVVRDMDQSKTTSVSTDQSRTRCDSGLANEVASSEDEGAVIGKEKQKATNSSSNLEVIARPKKLTKPKDSVKQEDMSTLSKVPPMCFKLNARPPSGCLYYFAYGSDMNTDRLCSYLGSGSNPPPKFWALLFGFELTFNKKVSDDLSVGGFPNLSYNPTSSVEGSVYQLTPGQLSTLDQFMSYPKLTEHVCLPVWMSNCSEPDELGIAQYCVPAVMYIAQNEATWMDPVQPNDYAVEQCCKAATDIVTPSYRSHLDSFVQKEKSQALVLVS